jgi:hypothetical protein
MEGIWGIYAAKQSGTLADIEYDILANDLIDDPAKTPDPLLPRLSAN